MASPLGRKAPSVDELEAGHGDTVGTEVRIVFERITVDVEQMAAVPCFRGMRIPVATVVGMVADGMSPAEILDEALADLEAEDITEALRYAAAVVDRGGLALRGDFASGT